MTIGVSMRIKTLWDEKLICILTFEFNKKKNENKNRNRQTIDLGTTAKIINFIFEISRKQMMSLYRLNESTEFYARKRHARI